MEWSSLVGWTAHTPCYLYLLSSLYLEMVSGQMHIGHCTCTFLFVILYTVFVCEEAGSSLDGMCNEHNVLLSMSRTPSTKTM